MVRAVFSPVFSRAAAAVRHRRPCAGPVLVLVLVLASGLGGAAGAFLLSDEARGQSQETAERAPSSSSEIVLERGRETGLPLPRWAALHASKVRMRAGPGLRYPTQWIYTRKGLPVRIVDEYESWRRISDWEGSEGWVHASLLRGSARFQVLEDNVAVRRAPEDSAPAVAFLERTVVGELLHCASAWCEVRGGRRRGWVPRSSIFGGFPPE